jgi:hypothetical protein
MRIIEIKNMTRKDFPIYYRRFYAGIAVMELVNGIVEVPLEFQIEHKPTGGIDIVTVLGQKIDDPLVPIQKELKKYIGALDSEGKLPN